MRGNFVNSLESILSHFEYAEQSIVLRAASPKVVFSCWAVCVLGQLPLGDPLGVPDHLELSWERKRKQRQRVVVVFKVRSVWVSRSSQIG